MPRPAEHTVAVGGLHLVGIAEGGVETNLRVPDLKLMFDLGMCPPGALPIGTVLVSHGHADHLGGLHYYISQRAMMKLPPPVIHLPEEIVEPVERMLACWAEIEGFDYRYELRPAAPGQTRGIGRNLTATPIRTHHRVPSLAWVIERTTVRLDESQQGLPGEELGRLRERGELITHETVTPILGVTGDTTIETFLEHELLRRCKVLVHECTSWDQQRDIASTRAYGHTHVEEIIEHLDRFEGETLVLVHRSIRHSRSYAQRIVEQRFPAELRERVVVFGHD